MCLLAVYPPNVQPNAAALSRAASRNPDGYGWAIVVGDQIVTHKTLNASDGVQSFVVARAQHPQGWAMWHARFTTHGTSDLLNVHPFPVQDDPRVVVAHNGVLPIDPTGDLSDTHEFAKNVADIADLDNAAAMFWMGEWARGSKLAFLSVHPDTNAQCYIVNEDAGAWHESGCWYSNEGHREQVAHVFSADPRRSVVLGSSPSSVGVGAWTWDDDDDDDLCRLLGDTDDAGMDPWAHYRPGDTIRECGSCGTFWPGFVEWCEDCGTLLQQETAAKTGGVS